MIKNVFALVIVALIGVSSPVRAIPIQYTLNQFTGTGGLVLDGSITVDDDGDGLVDRSEITAWDFTSTGSALSVSSGATSSVDCMSFANSIVDCFSIGANSLVTGSAVLGDYFAFFSDTSTGYGVAFVSFPQIGTVDIAWAIGNVSDTLTISQVSPSQGLIVASASTIPEPSSLALLMIALVMFFGFAAKRSGTPQFSPA